MFKLRLRQAALTTAAALLITPAFADLAPYAQDFEALDAESADALSADGWVIFASVFAPDGTTLLYSYGEFVAPNGSGAFSNVAIGEGGVDQGEQQLVTFSDYQNADHNIGNRLETSVFQNQTIGAADIGSTYDFTFDAKMGDLIAPSTAFAFIKTLDPNAGFATTNLFSIDTTALPATWDSYTLSLSVDESLVGQLLQIGFTTTAANFDASGVVYDNLVFDLNDSVQDADGDGVTDDIDNCTNVVNADQRDTNGDGFGNVCDADINNDNIINATDLGLFRLAFFSMGPGLDADFNGDNVVNAVDLGVLRLSFFTPPGPAAAPAL